MLLFEIIVYLILALLFAGKSVNFAAAEVVTSAAMAVVSDNLSGVPGAAQLQTKGIAPLESEVAAGLLSTLSEESSARTHVLSTATMSATATHAGNTSVAMSPLTTTDPSITSNTTSAQITADLTLNTSTVSLESTLSGERVAGADHTMDTISATVATVAIVTTTSDGSVSVTPWLTLDLTLTYPATSTDRSASPTVVGNLTSSATDSITFSGANFSVTFTDVSPTGTGQAHSVSVIDQPTLATPAISATAGAPTSSTTSGGPKGAKLVYNRFIAVLVCLVGVLFSP